jgi:hypothetical protein
LPWNSPGVLVLVAAFLVGAVLFAFGTVLVRRSEVRVPAAESGIADRQAVPWTAELAGTNEALSRELRVDMVERLAMIGEPWCRDVLERACTHDPDAMVRDAAENAIIVIAARAR